MAGSEGKLDRWASVQIESILMKQVSRYVYIGRKRIYTGKSIVKKVKR